MNQVQNNQGGQITQQQYFGNIEQEVMTEVGRLKDNGMIFPVGYNPQRALTNFLLKVQQDDKLINCTPVSIKECATQMMTLGLDVATNQCYPIAFGNKCTLLTSYFGKQTVVKRIKGVIDVVSQPIFEGDEIDYDIENGSVTNLKHKTKFGNRKNGVDGAYCIIMLDKEVFGRSEHIEVMDITEIENAWGQGHAKGNSPAHKKFKPEMARKSAIARACKNLVNTVTDEQDMKLAQTFNEVQSNDYIKREGATEAEVVEQNVTFDTPKVEEQPTETIPTDDVFAGMDNQTMAENMFEDTAITAEDLGEL